jgi:hypothetical protein
MITTLKAGNVFHSNPEWSKYFHCLYPNKHILFLQLSACLVIGPSWWGNTETRSDGNRVFDSIQLPKSTNIRNSHTTTVLCIPGNLWQRLWSKLGFVKKSVFILTGKNPFWTGQCWQVLKTVQIFFWHDNTYILIHKIRNVKTPFWCQELLKRLLLRWRFCVVT